MHPSTPSLDFVHESYKGYYFIDRLPGTIREA